MVLVAPSILSADFGRLAEEVKAVDEAGADWIHFDVMDGRYVPNLTVGPMVVTAVRRATKKPIDVHLMVVEPERWVEPFAEAGADHITVHQEACTHLQRALVQIRGLGKKAGVSLNPATTEETLRYVAGDVDIVLIMSVNPGFGGQKFLTTQIEKVRRVRQMLDAAGNSAAIIEVDGGVSPANARLLCDVGAGALVAGNAIFKTPDYATAIRELRSAAKGGEQKRGDAR